MLKLFKQKSIEWRSQQLIDDMIFCLQKMQEINKKKMGLTKEGDEKFWEYNNRYEILRTELFRINNLRDTYLLSDFP